LLAKITGAALIFYLSNITASGTFWSNPHTAFSWPQDQVLLASTTGTDRWPLPFVGWDSAWYLSILTHGYMFSAQSYTFSPALPFCGYLFNLIVQNPLVSLVFVSAAFGIILIPLYQLLAEDYLSRKTALLSTLLFAFLPYVFVFTTVAYSESLMLFFVLGAWVLANRGRMLEASMLAMAAPLARTMGILVVIPLLYNALKNRNHRLRNVVLSILPIASLGGWFAYLGSATGVMFAPVSTTEWGNLWTVRSLIFEGIPKYGFTAVMQAPYQFAPIVTHWLLPFAAVAALVVPLLFLMRLWRKSRLLWLYGIAGYLGVLWFGAVVSLPRFVSVIFPFAIAFSSLLSEGKKSFAVTIALLAAFLFVSIDLWICFLGGQFIS
jgi:hypothetical protein